MIDRILASRLAAHPKSVLLLGPRQVGKSTLCLECKPDLIVNLADEETFRQHLNDPGLIRRIVNALPKKRGLVLVDEVQRLPNMLNTIQSLLDSLPLIRFLLTGSSARKLRRGRANLLPGRVLLEHLPPLVYWEIAGIFDLGKALSIGTLPEVYLQDYGPDILDSYVAGYLREEVQAEALTKDLASYSRFLDLAAALSGQYLNYSKIASDSEINKHAIRRYMEILSDTLLVELLPSYTEVGKARRARQREKFIFFDLGVRNSLLGRRKPEHFSREEFGSLFEQWMILQVLYYNRLHKKGWRISSYRDAMGVEVDLVIETSGACVAVEFKSSPRARENMFKGLVRFEQLAGREVTRCLVYRGEHEQRFERLGMAFPYRKFLQSVVPAMD